MSLFFVPLSAEPIINSEVFLRSNIKSIINSESIIDNFFQVNY